MNILVCEDEPLLALELEDFLLEEGARVIGPFASYAEALQSVETHVIAGAVLDIRLKDGSSSHLAEALASRGIPFVVASGSLPSHYPAIAKLAEFWLIKPFLPEQAGQVFHELIAKGSAIDRAAY
jgi:DNA-binding response OmpR family regulator